MSKIEQLKAEMAVIRDKIDELERHGDLFNSARLEQSLDRKYDEYVYELEDEVERLKAELTLFQFLTIMIL